MNLILLEPAELSDAGRVVLSDQRAAHLRDVLAVTKGREVRVGVLDGPRGVGVVEAVDPAKVTLACRLQASTPERPALDLLLALPRPKVLKRLWSQLAALGVGRVMLSSAERVERYYFDSHAIEEATYLPRLKEGLSQAKDTRLPLVTVSRSLRKLVEEELDDAIGDARRVIADPAYERSVLQVARSTSPGRRVLLALGPEGGWTRDERDLFARHGFVGASLGPRTLRSDTAVIALIAILHEGLRSA